MIKQKISQYLESKGISKYKFYQTTGLSNGFLDKEGAIGTDKCEIISSHYPDLNLDWLIGGNGPMLKGAGSDPAGIEQKSEAQSIPLLPVEAFAGIAHNGGYAIQASDIMDNYVVPLFDDVGADFMIKVRGSSMYPKYNSGDVVACRFINEILFLQWGKVYVLDTSSQGAMVKRIFEGADKEHIICRSDNKTYPDFQVPLADINNLALVVGVIRVE